MLNVTKIYNLRKMIRVEVRINLAWIDGQRVRIEITPLDVFWFGGTTVYLQ